MPTYEYLCESNGRVVEVRHKMAERIATWGELAAQAGIRPGETDPGAPVVKLMSAGFVRSGDAKTRGESSCDLPACGQGVCGGGMCGLQ